METTSLTFAHTAWFLGLLLVPAFAGLYFWSQRRGEALVAKVVAPRLRAQLAGNVSVGLRALKAVVVLLALAAIVVALARPQWGFEERKIKQRGRDIIIAVDTSRSMLATDIQPTRLDRAKLVAQDLMNLVQGDRFGLIAFAGSAFLQAPLTLDDSAVYNSLQELDTNIIPKGGTNIAAAIQQAEDAFGKGEGESHALVILTDGEELDADGVAAAKEAAAKGIRIFTVGVGSPEGSLIPIRGDGGGTDYVRDSSGKMVTSRLDANRLKEIAEVTGGFYTPLSADTARLIYQKGIEPMKTSESSELTSKTAIERYEWPAGVAIGLLAFWLLLGDRRRKGRRLGPAAAVLLLAAIPAAQADNGVQEYQAGNYDKALADFQRQLETNPGSAKLQYDTGAAAYKTGDYGKAVDYFTQALLADDRKLREDASYNLGNSLVRRGEKAQGNDQKKADWKNAIQHYTEALNIDPKNKNAEENRDLVKKLLEDLEKQEQQQKQDQQKQDQQKQDQKDQKNDQQQKQDQQQNQQKQDQKDQQKQDQSGGQQNKQDQQQGQQDQKDQNKDQKNQQQNQSPQNQQGDQNKPDQQKQPDQNKKDDEQKQDQQKKDQSGSGQDQKDQQQQKQGDQKQDQQPKPSPSPSASPTPQNPQGNQPQDQGSQKQQQGSRPQPGDQNSEGGASPTPLPTPGEKKQGELKSAGGDQKDQQPQGGAGAQQGEAAKPEKDGEMSAAQARSLLNSLRSDEEHVKMMQRQEAVDTLKDW